MKFFKKRKIKNTIVQEDSYELIYSLINKAIPNLEIKLTPDIKLQELGLDSIKFMSLIIGLEDMFSKNLEDVIDQIDFSSIQTINDLSLIIDKINK